MVKVLLVLVLLTPSLLWGANEKITEFTEQTTIVGTDIVPIVNDPGGTPVTKKMTLDTLRSVPINSDANGMTGAEMTTAGMYGTLFIATGAGTWTLPTAVAGMSICLMDSGTAHDLILDVQAGDDIQLKGTELANGTGITNAAGSSTGDFVCVVAISAGHWVTMGMGGTWASQ